MLHPIDFIAIIILKLCVCFYRTDKLGTSFNFTELKIVTYRAMLNPTGTKAKRSPINSTTRKKKLELDALTGLAAGLRVCIKTI